MVKAGPVDTYNPYSFSVAPAPRRGTPCKVAEVAGLLGKIMKQYPDEAFEKKADP